MAVMSDPSAALADKAALTGQKGRRFAPRRRPARAKSTVMRRQTRTSFMGAL